MEQSFVALAFAVVLIFSSYNHQTANQTNKNNTNKEPTQKSDNPEIIFIEQPNLSKLITKEQEQKQKEKEEALSESKKKELEENKKLFEKLLSNATVLDTSKWQTYSNLKAKYSFKYPSNWHHVTDPGTGQNEGQDVSFDSFGLHKSIDGDSYYGMLEPDPGFLLDISVSKKTFRNLQGINFLTDGIVVINSKQTTVTLYYYEFENSPKKYYAEIYTKVGKYNYSIQAHLYNLNPEDKNNDINLLMTILKNISITNNTFSVPIDADGDTFLNTEDCDDTNSKINTAAPEVCANRIDENCDGVIIKSCQAVDTDGDGFSFKKDCNEYDVLSFPGGWEICDDGIDQDCSGRDLLCIDVDMDFDGFTPRQGDCNDSWELMSPAKIEICDRIDNNCDGLVDEGMTLNKDGICPDFEDCFDKNIKNPNPHCILYNSIPSLIPRGSR